MAAGAPVTLRYTGTSVKRLEDPRLLTGRARYLDDLVLPRMLSACFARSPHAHARIVRIDAAAAMALPGVLAVVTADADVDRMPRESYDEIYGVSAIPRLTARIREQDPGGIVLPFEKPRR